MRRTTTPLFTSLRTITSSLVMVRLPRGGEGDVGSGGGRRVRRGGFGTGRGQGERCGVRERNVLDFRGEAQQETATVVLTLDLIRAQEHEGSAPKKQGISRARLSLGFKVQ